MHRETYSEHLKELESLISTMSSMVILAVSQSVESLKNQDSVLAQRIMDDDIKINQKRWEIEEKSINLIALQQPVASDLREIIAILNIIVELERIGDYAAGIAKIAILHSDKPLIKPLVDIPRMMEKGIEMVADSIQAFIKKDVALARKTWNQDDEVDKLYDQNSRELITYMIEDPTSITRATYLLWVAHNLERIADRVTNICERTVYLVTGKMEIMKNEI